MPKKASMGMLVGFACGVSAMVMLHHMIEDPTFPLPKAERDKLMDDFDAAAEAKAVERGVPVEHVRTHRRRQLAIMLTFLNEVLQSRAAPPSVPPGALN